MLRYTSLKNIENMSVKELMAELVDRKNFSPNVLRHLDRKVLEREVGLARERKINKRQLWINQAERDVFILIGKGKREDQYLIRSLTTGDNLWIDYSTLEGPNWTRLA